MVKKQSVKTGGRSVYRQRARSADRCDQSGQRVALDLVRVDPDRPDRLLRRGWGGAEITGNIARSSRNRQKMSLVKTGGKPAHTIVNVMDAWTRPGISLFRCTLMTGRTHQIRVHLSSHGFPVLCDPLYGREKSHLGSVKDPALLEFLKTHNGQMLHAEVLEFKHPTTGEQMHFKSRMPIDMMELKEILDGE